tara:strand:+ start:418 stop:1104 length:687 start_codon:yes stop_codon:yes gene_type:complete
MNYISIVIPLYNEEGNIESLHKEIIKSLKVKIKYEIIYVNDGSTDNTAKILNNLNYNENFKVINHKKNLGQSHSISSGINNSNYDTIVTLDGDGQNVPNDINKLINKFFSSNVIFLVGGIRVNRKDSLIKIISSKIANNIRLFFLDDDCIDSGCGLKVFSKDVFLKIPFFEGMHRFLPALFKGFGYKTLFIEVNHRPRLKGSTKYGTIIRLIRGIIDIIRVKKMIKKK